MCVHVSSFDVVVGSLAEAHGSFIWGCCCLCWSLFVCLKLFFFLCGFTFVLAEDTTGCVLDGQVFDGFVLFLCVC